MNWRNHNKRLHRYALRKICNETDAEEIADQTLVRFLEYMERREWQEEIRSVKAYLYGIAKNLCAEVMSRRMRETTLDSDDDDEQGEQTRRILEKKAMQDNNPTSRLENDIRLRELLDSLPKALVTKLSAEEKRLLYMHKALDMNAEEISQALCRDVFRVRYELNKLDAKIRYRVRQLSK